MDSPRFISVILATYNQPEWLSKVLWGYACQSHSDFEVVIADDGSDDRTRQAIESIRSQTQLKIQHVWHADDGFQKCAILNKAIQQATGDYLLFSDGDCIPRKTFVANHHRFARRDRFLSGGYFTLPLSISLSLTIEDIGTGRAFDWPYLRGLGVPWSKRCVRFLAGKHLAAALNFGTTTRPTWNGNNSSGWKDDILAVNGFDERMKFGGLDREIGERLENAGVHGTHIRYNTVVLQLDQTRGYVSEADLARDHAIRQLVREERRTWTDYGIQKTVGQEIESLRRAS